MTTNSILDKAKLHRAMVVRELSISGLALKAGVSAPTVRRALTGSPIQVRKARLILLALLATPVIEEINEFVAD